jgi:7-cyano-7-deazaguanine synthase in queuosine biosynthesis
VITTRTTGDHDAVARAQSNRVAERPAVLKAVGAMKDGQLTEVDIRQWRAVWDNRVRMGDVPRNATIALLAVPIARMHRCNTIAVGSTEEDAAMPDGQPEFYRALNILLEHSKVPQRVSAVWLDDGMRKPDFIKWALAQPHLGEAFVRSTRSCWKPTSADDACGFCPACKARINAFDEAGLRQNSSPSRSDSS